MAKWMDLRHTYNLKGKLLLSCLGVVCIALGTTVCRVGNVGVDPFTAMNLGFSARVGMDFGTFQLLVNLAILAAVFALDKYQIGLGTLINMVGVGYLIELFTWLLGFLPKFEGLVSAGVHLVVGTLLFTLGVSLYLKTRMGVAPIDAVAPIAAERLPFSYTACRMTQDISVTVLAVLAGGPIGVFTVIAHNNSAADKYIQRVKLNGEPYAKPYIGFEEIAAGGTLEFEMGPEPALWYEL